jgi:TATA-binding protein-associated factor
MDNHIEKSAGQDVIDSLSVLDAVAPTFHEDIWPHFHALFPMIGLALRSRFAIIRQCAAKCFATICNVMTVAAMRYVIENIVPYLGDSVNLHYRQGSTELIYREYMLRSISICLTNMIIDIVQTLDIKALPYVIFMIVPVLGRMSDSDDDIRSTATNTFASLVKMVPLEVSDWSHS